MAAQRKHRVEDLTEEERKAAEERGKQRSLGCLMLVLLIAAFVYLPGLLDKGKQKREQEAVREAPPSWEEPEVDSDNPLGLLDQFGRPEENPFKVGDHASTVSDHGNRINPGTFAHLWLSLSDRTHCNNNWRDYPGFGEGQKSDACVKSMLEKGRILPLPIGTTVEILGLLPPRDKKYIFTWFKVQVVDGEYSDKVGWLSHSALDHMGR